MSLTWPLLFEGIETGRILYKRHWTKDIDWKGSAANQGTEHNLLYKKGITTLLQMKDQNTLKGEATCKERALLHQLLIWCFCSVTFSFVNLKKSWFIAFFHNCFKDMHITKFRMAQQIHICEIDKKKNSSAVHIYKNQVFAGIMCSSPYWPAVHSLLCPPSVLPPLKLV